VRSRGLQPGFTGIRCVVTSSPLGVQTTFGVFAFFTFFDALMVGIGLPTNTITDRQFIQRTEAQYENFYREKTTDLKKDYVKAMKDGNSDKLEEVRSEWQSMQDSRRANGFKIQPMSELFKAPQAAQKHSVKTMQTLNTSGRQASGFSVR